MGRDARRAVERAGTVLLAALFATSAVAAPVPSMSAGEARVAMAEALARGQAGDCAGLLARLDPLLPSVAGDTRTGVQLLRAPCLPPVGRVAELSAVVTELERDAPDNRSVGRLAIAVAATEGRFGEAADRLTRIANDGPAGLEGIRPQLVGSVVEGLAKAHDVERRDKLFVALAGADWTPSENPELREGLARDAIRALLASGGREQADALLPRVTAPELLFGMALDRAYAPLWPQIGARMGLASGKAIDRFAEDRLERFATSPADPVAQGGAVRAFLLLRRYPDAIDAAATVSPSVGIGHDAARTVQLSAQALAASGRREEAAARLRPLAMLDPASTPSAVFAAITLAELDDELGQNADALAVSRGMLGHADALTAWSQAWLRRSEACALVQLGREEEAGLALDALAPLATDNAAAAIEGLLCAGRKDAAAAVAVAALGTRDGASDLADQFQPSAALFTSWAPRLHGLWQGLLKRADVAAAFNRVARTLPEPLWPARSPRPIPHADRTRAGPLV